VGGTPQPIRWSTLAYNSAPLGGGVYYEDIIYAGQIDHTIIAFSAQGESVACSDVAWPPSVTCSDVFGNVGGDWSGTCIAGHAPEWIRMGYNVCVDPVFCSATCLDFRLQMGHSAVR